MDMKAKIIRTKEKKKNNIAIIINGEDAEEIKEKILFEVKKLARKKELGYYIALEEAASLDSEKEEKIRKALKQQGIRIKAVGLTEKERKIIEEAMRKIKYGRKKAVAHLSRT